MALFGANCENSWSSGEDIWKNIRNFAPRNGYIVPVCQQNLHNLTIITYKN